MTNFTLPIFFQKALAVTSTFFDASTFGMWKKRLYIQYKTREAILISTSENILLYYA